MSHIISPLKITVALRYTIGDMIGEKQVQCLKTAEIYQSMKYVHIYGVYMIKRSHTNTLTTMISGSILFILANRKARRARSFCVTSQDNFVALTT